MQIVLGVSMTPTAARMVLVEGAGGDGVTVDTGVFRDPEDVTQQVIAAIMGTRDNAVDGGHRLVVTGVAWTDHDQAARLRDALRARGISDVVMVSELHAAGALAMAAGQKIAAVRTALLLIDQHSATLAVVRSADGAVVGVQSRNLHGAGADANAVVGLQDMVGALERASQPPQAVFVVGSRVDISALTARIAERTMLPVHAPDNAELALARGAAMASASAPRHEAATVGLIPGGIPTDDGLTAAGMTQLGYVTPLGYSAVPDYDDDLEADDVEAGEPIGPSATAETEQKPFLLVGSALASFFVVGVVSLVFSLAVSIRPAVEQSPDTGPAGRSIGVPAQGVATASSSAPETIAAPLPVAQEAPRTVYVQRPAAPVPAVEPVAPATAPAAPAAPPAVLPAPPPAVAPAPAPAPVFPPSMIAPMLPALLPPIFQAPIFQSPVRSTPLPRSSSAPASPTYSAPPSTPAAPASPTYSAPPSTPSTASSTQSAPSRDSGESGTRTPATTTTVVWPLLPGAAG